MADLWYSALQQILPQADAGPDQNVDGLDTVTLDASGSLDPKNGNLTYQWVQTDGTAVVLSDAQSVQPTFVAPPIGSCGQTLSFRVTVTDEDELESSDTVTIAVGSKDNCPFEDVLPGSFADDEIYKIFDAGITTGCSKNPLKYCPKSTVTRAQMAIFLLRSKFGGSYTPPPAVGLFTDVPVTSFAADWIEDLYVKGITTGCRKNPLKYCPGSAVKRDAMAVFITRTFGL